MAVKQTGIKIICENRKARFNYEIMERFEAGLVLLGTEVKSLRAGQAHLGDAYATLRGSEVFLLQCHISPYQTRHHADHEPMRPRKLLLHGSEIKKLIGKIQEKGLTLIPLKMYFKEGRAKVELGLCKSKKTIDKRETIKRRESDRQIRREMKKR